MPSRSPRRAPGPLVWIDCEMTGLDHKNDRIIEICCLLTDANLELLEPAGYEAAIATPQAVLDAMGPWCQTTHTNSGLIKRIQASTVSLEQAQAELLAYLKKHLEKGVGVLAGNSVHVDRLFMLKDFPEVVEYLHYRLVDVSSIKEVGLRHNPALMRSVPSKKMGHTARADILESIDELRWYTKNYLRGPEEGPAAKPEELPVKRPDLPTVKKASTAKVEGADPIGEDGKKVAVDNDEAEPRAVKSDSATGQKRSLETGTDERPRSELKSSKKEL